MNTRILAAFVFLVLGCAAIVYTIGLLFGMEGADLQGDIYRAAFMVAIVMKWGRDNDRD